MHNNFNRIMLSDVIRAVNVRDVIIHENTLCLLSL